jgi:hypothetical protein
MIMAAVQASINVLIVDDEAGCVEALQNDADPHGILLNHATNLEDAQRLLKEKGDRAFAGVILDRDCYFDSKLTDKGNILASGTRFFRENAKNLPVVILTAHKELAASEQGRMYKIFSKDNNDVDAMFVHLKAESLKLEQIRYANSYPEVFDAIDTRIPAQFRSDVRDDIICALKVMFSKNPSDIKNGLVCLRRIIEYVHRSINRINDNALPDYILTRGTFKSAMDQLVSARLLEQYDLTYNSFWNVHKVVSEFGAHANPERTYPYAFRTAIFQTMDILVWFKDAKI